MQKIKTQETHKSIPKDLEWNDIPRFAIITGKNGSGKSQLLEQMKNIRNWVDNSCTAKYIKHIPAIYSFNTNPKNSNNSKSSIIDTNSTHKNNVLNSFKKIIETDTKQYIKDNNINILILIDMMARYNNNLGSIQKNHPTESAQLIQDNYKLFHLISSRTQYKSIFTSILTKSGKTLIEDITEEEFLDSIPPDMNNDFTAISHLKQWFTVYLDNLRYRALNILGNESGTKKLLAEKPPWILMNEILTEYKFKYYIKDFDSSLNPLQIHFTENGQDIIPIEDLSSGEQQLISLVAWAHHEVIAQNIKVLLLDEPDAHLHPSFCKIFVEIMDTYIVEGLGIQVIMTTHSPSTIAYAPEESIFVMKMPEESDPTSRVMKQTKEKALSILSDGLMTITDDLVGVIGEIFNNKENNLFIVEGEKDKQHVENCIKLFNAELQGFFDKWTILGINGSDNLGAYVHVFKTLNKEVLGFCDEDAKEKAKKLGIDIINGDIESYTGITNDFLNENLDIIKIKADRNQADDENNEKKHTDLSKKLKNAKKNIWLDHLTRMITENPDQAKEHYKNFKEFLINKVFK